VTVRAAVGLILVVAAIAGASVPAAGSSVTATVKIPASVVVRTAKLPGPKDPHRCVAIAFAQYSAVRGGKSYAVHVRGRRGSSDVRGGGPPFTQDTFPLSVGKRKVVLKAPSGKHWLVLGSSSTGQGCEESKKGLIGRFAIARATATVG
jgi:hypothetical protein